MNKTTALESVKSLNSNEKKEVLLSAAKDLNNEERQNLSNDLNAIIGQPTQKAADTLWLIIVVSFAVGFLLSIGAIVYSSVFLEAISDKLVIIFTTTSAFLAGILAPSPMGK